MSTIMLIKTISLFGTKNQILQLRRVAGLLHKSSTQNLKQGYKASYDKASGCIYIIHKHASIMLILNRVSATQLREEMLVLRPKNIYPAKGLPLYVHLKAFAAVLLKYSINSVTLIFNSSVELTDSLFNKRRANILNQTSTWLSQEACFGV